jgi:hypothetical protein
VLVATLNGVQDESDQALVAYRTAAKLFPGCHLCTLFVGMECARTNNLQLASRVRRFNQTAQAMPAIDAHQPSFYPALSIANSREPFFALRVADNHVPHGLPQYFEQAVAICPNDPHVYNEIGVIHYKNQE